MGVSRTWAVALSGLDGALVEVEAAQSSRIPELRIIGLPDKALGEAAQRVRAAGENCGLSMPRRALTVNLSPASLPKQGSGFDVAIAVAALATDGLMDAASVARTAHIGELGLDGRLRPVPGVLPAVVAAARAGIERVVVPHACAAEASLVDGIRIVGAVSLTDVVRLHGGPPTEAPPMDPVPLRADEGDPAPPTELAEVVGQEDAVDALIVAAAGGHHLLMTGPAGAGKTMLARRLPGILPPLDDAAALRVASVRSLCGMPVAELSHVPPFEAPHHTASVAALVGGGSRDVRPGAVARASDGVLFLDEATEHRGGTLDALRQPLETGAIVIHRAGFTASFPARFQLVMAANPCPCGNFGVRGAECTCSPAVVRRYAARLSGPLLDRVDIELAVRRVSALRRGALTHPVSSATARERVAQARARARHRLGETPWTTNAEVSGEWLRRGPCAPAADVSQPLEAALFHGSLSLRGYDRILRTAWSVADLAGHDRLTAPDVGRALYLKKGIRL